MAYQLHSFWLPWVVGGYFISQLSYNAVDELNMLLLNPLPMASSSSTSQLIPPGKPDVFALALACVGPCMTAPVFEEVLYRGFLLPALSRFLPLAPALLVQSAMFALHHLSARGFLPLTILGFVWSLLYVASGNLVVPMLVHAMWNLRVFWYMALQQYMLRDLAGVI